MAYHYNILEESWIDVLTTEGDIESYGIEGVLLNAAELLEIVDASPLMKYGMYRFLIAFMSDALAIKKLSDIENLLKTGEFPSDKIEQYCEKYSHKFDLFSTTEPFGQTIRLKKLKKTNYIPMIIHHLPTGINPIHFFNVKQDEHKICPKICARAILAFSPFAVGFGKSHNNSEGKGVSYTSSINKAPPWYFLIKGKNLFLSRFFPFSFFPPKKLRSCQLKVEK